MPTLAAPVYDELALTAPGAPVSRVPDLRRVQDAFIARWAEMARTWGINLTMGEIFAFLYVTGQPRCTPRDGAAEHQPRQREHKSARVVRLGRHPPDALPWRPAGIFRKPRRRVGDVQHHCRGAQ